MGSNTKTAIPSPHGEAYRVSILSQYVAYFRRNDPDMERVTNLATLVGYTSDDLAKARVTANMRNVDIDPSVLKQDMEAVSKVLPIVDDCSSPNIDTHTH